LNRESSSSSYGHKIQSQVQTAQQEPEGVYLAQPDEGDPEELGEGDTRAPRWKSSASASTTPTCRRRRRRPADNELERLKMIPARVGRAHRRPHLSRVARQPAVVEVDEATSRPSTRASSSTRTTTTSEDQGSHPRVPRGAEAEAGLQGADPLLRRPAGNRKTSLGRSIARRWAGIPADLARRRARRGRDPRPPATYIGALPAASFKPSATQPANNPLFMLDEIDKLGMTSRRPRFGALEVLTRAELDLRRPRSSTSPSTSRR